ncbi:Helix-turn-helix domain protein [Tsuneonella dongtanensis]|uniref:Helix-turn-helix domain protein n=1 Tax=Tsuneonella dongtanensis TaxID=692370 RepID=A0A1B2AGY5_9SPHN|nr:AraC family transcriptional regulator [Tsuneonella dongtanensis]ANY21407.1 Helix-turn-helix domain protein [Tsuneonella dongtanensis]
MTGFVLSDMLARGGTLALLALWSWILLRDHRTVLAARIAVAMNVAIAGHVLATIPNDPFPSMLNAAFDSVSVTTSAWFYLFARAWFGDERRIPLAAWLGVPWLLAIVVLIYAQGSYREPATLWLQLVLRVSMAAYALAGLWIAWRGRADDLVEVRRRLRTRLVGVIGAFVIAIVGLETLVSLGALPDISRSLIEFGVTALTFAFCARMFGTRRSDLFGPPQRSAVEHGTSSTDYQPLVERLRAHMAAEKPYRDEGLTIAALAAQLGEPEYRLRRAINGTLGHRNFPQFLNSYRLDEVRAALADPGQREVPILTIALDAGFGSLGPFNRAFRDAEGTTPSAWRDRALADSEIG